MSDPESDQEMRKLNPVKGASVLVTTDKYEKLQARVETLEAALTNLTDLIASDAGYISASSPTFKAARATLKREREMIKSKLDLMSIKHSRIIEDPFPELTADSQNIETENSLSSFFGFGKKILDKSSWPNPWKAYRLGYEKAYNEIESAISEQGEK